jgi:hypothetical protein
MQTLPGAHVSGGLGIVVKKNMIFSVLQAKLWIEIHVLRFANTPV